MTGSIHSRTDCSGRLAPAHSRYETWGARASSWIPVFSGISKALRRLLERMRMARRRTVQPRPNDHPALGWGQAPALHFSVLTIGCPCWAGSCWRRAPVPKSIGVPMTGPAGVTGSIHSRTDRSGRLAPAHSRYETWGARASSWIPVFSGISKALRRLLERMRMARRRTVQPRPNDHPALGWGQAPALHFSVLTIGCPCWAGSCWRRAPVPKSIGVPMTGPAGAAGSMYPGSESGTCFRINDD